jgi:hypothetical protein
VDRDQEYDWSKLIEKLIRSGKLADKKTWTVGVVTNQLDEPSSVGHAWCAWQEYKPN